MFTKYLLRVAYYDHTGDTAVSKAMHPYAVVYKWDAVCEVTVSAVKGEDYPASGRGHLTQPGGVGAGASWEKDYEELLRRSTRGEEAGPRRLQRHTEGSGLHSGNRVEPLEGFRQDTGYSTGV